MLYFKKFFAAVALVFSVMLFAQRYTVQVTKIVDGDTFHAKYGKQSYKFRLIGIDAPESRNTGRKKVRHPYGPAAKQCLASMMPAGSSVMVEYDAGKTDRYGRQLVNVYRQGLFINAEMLRRGCAGLMTVPPNVRHAETFRKLNKTARNQRKGVYSADLYF